MNRFETLWAEIEREFNVLAAMPSWAIKRTKFQ